MAKVNKVNIGSFMRGDSAVIPWAWKKRGEDGQLTPLSLRGYKASMTIKSEASDYSVDDEENSTTPKGYNNTYFKIDVDCDNSVQMHGVSPDKGEVLFHLPKQATWVDPAPYQVDIVVQNKSSRWTTTVFSGQLEIIGHPTNRLTTDAPDSWNQ